MSKKKISNPDVVGFGGEQEWFYSQNVKEHFFHPRNIFKTAAEAEKYKSDGIGIVGSPACLVGDSVIHTNPGTERIDNFVEGKTVLSHTGEYNPVLKVFSRDYDGKIVKLSNQLGKIGLTPEHLVFAIKKPVGHKFNYTKIKRLLPAAWFCSEHLSKGDILLFPIPKEIKEVKCLEVPRTKARYDFKSKQLQREVKITPELLELFGFFISEGNTKKTEVNFSFSSSETMFAERVKEITKKTFGLEARIKTQPERNTIRVNIYNVYLAKWFASLFGAGAENKKIPTNLMFLNPELQKSLIRGIWLGDGYINLKMEYPRAGFSTISPVLVQQLKLLLLRQKIALSVYSEEPVERKGVKHRKSYRLHVGDLDALAKISGILGEKFSKNNFRRSEINSWFDENYYYAPIRKVETTRFSGRVYNLEVGNAHSYVSDALTVHNCGDVMKIWIKVDKKADKIKECKWQTFGCASAIASTSMLSVMVTERGGMKLDSALKITPQDIIKRLGGLPERKIHCSVLGDKALRAAINNYFEKTKQFSRIFGENTRIVDADTGITNKDIEEAVLDGARTFEEVQRRTKVAIKDKSIVPEVKRLVAYYAKKHFGTKFK